MEQPNKSLEHLEEAVHLAKLIGDETTVGRVYLNIGHANLIGGDLTNAEIYMLQAETIFRRFSNTAELARVWGNLGRIYSHQDQWQNALTYLEKSLAGWRTLNNKIDEINTLIDMIEYELLRGHRSRAARRLKEVEQLLGVDPKNAQYRHIQPQLERYRQQLMEE